MVDDDDDILTMLSCAVEEWGYSVFTAKDGNQALETVDHIPRLALVLLDLRIPGRGGMEVLKEIHAQHPTIGVIMLTGVVDREIAHQAMKLGAFDYVSKPVDLPALESVIVACLSHAEYHHQSLWKRLVG